jgi:hypothetical protein
VTINILTPLTKPMKLICEICLNLLPFGSQLIWQPSFLCVMYFFCTLIFIPYVAPEHVNPFAGH